MAAALPRLVELGQQPPTWAESTGQKIVVAIPCLNEERHIGSLVLQVKRTGADVIVIDDGSTDETAEIAEAAGAMVIRHETNQGKGAALNSAFGLAIGMEADVLILMDGDGQHRPAEIPNVAAPIVSGEADISV